MESVTGKTRTRILITLDTQKGLGERQRLCRMLTSCVPQASQACYTTVAMQDVGPQYNGSPLTEGAALDRLNEL